MPQIFSGYVVVNYTRLLDAAQQPISEWVANPRFKRPQGSYGNPYIYTSAAKAMNAAGVRRPTTSPIRDHATQPVKLPEQSWEDWRPLYDRWLVEGITGYREHRSEAKRVTVNME